MSVARQFVEEPFLGQVQGAMPAFAVGEHVFPTVRDGVDFRLVGVFVLRRLDSLAEQRGVGLQHCLGGVEAAAEAKGGPAARAEDGLAAAPGDLALPGGVGEQVEHAAELALLELEGVGGQGVAPHHRHRLEFRPQVVHDSALHAHSRYVLFNGNTPGARGGRALYVIEA